VPTRRDFALTIGAATLGACVRTPSLPPAPSIPNPTPSPTSADADPNAALTDAMMDVVKHRYGHHLSEAQLAGVRDDIRGGLRASDRLRAILLPNSTEPDIVFAVHRGGTP
jgi:hypothetical protein